MDTQERIPLTITIRHEMADVLWHRSSRTGRAAESEASYLLELALEALVRTRVEDFNQHIARAVTGERYYTQAQVDAMAARQRRSERYAYEKRLRNLVVNGKTEATK